MVVRAWLLVPLAIAATLAPQLGGCTSSVSFIVDANGAGGPYVFIAGSGGNGGTAAPVGSGGMGGLPEYHDPGCPDPPPPLEQFMCDPYAQKGCPPGNACYIYVDYPKEPCGQEIYGSLCAPAGHGHQGDPCDGGGDCAGGFVCVITGSGTQCVKLCHIKGQSGCADGLVCEPIDVKGFGGCL